MLLYTVGTLVLIRALHSEAEEPSINPRSAWFGPSPSSKACYFAERYRILTYDKAREFCANRSAHLISFPRSKHTDPETEFDYITENGDKILAIPARLYWKDSFWLAYNDRVQEGTFLDEAGNRLDETWEHWHSNEPNNGDGETEQDCAVAVKNIGWLWDDMGCEQELETICQRFTTCRLPDGVASDTTVKAGETLQISCRQGYRLVGADSVKCGCDGRLDKCALCVPNRFEVSKKETATVNCVKKSKACPKCSCSAKVAVTVVLTFLTLLGMTAGASYMLIRKPVLFKRYVPFA